jgi:hypothetical protein
MSVKFVYYDEELKKEFEGINIFERRESDASPKDWKICYLE